MCIVKKREFFENKSAQFKKNNSWEEKKQALNIFVMLFLISYLLYRIYGGVQNIHW